MYLPKTVLKNHILKNTPYDIVASGSMSWITASDNPVTYLKHTFCEASSNFLESSKEHTDGPIKLIQGEYVDRVCLDTASGELIATTLEIPKLNKLKVSSLNKEQYSLYRKWKSLLTANKKFLHISDESHIKYINEMCEAAESALKGTPILEDTLNMILSLNFKERIDSKIAGNILIDTQGTLIINDPVFNFQTIATVRGW